MYRQKTTLPLPKVVNSKVDFLRAGTPRYENLAEWKAVPGHIYISAKLKYVVATEDSIWRTPYHRLEKENKEAGLQAYEKYVRENTELLRQIPHLSDTATELACWCRPDRCHGDVLVKLIDEYRRGLLTIPADVPIAKHLPPARNIPMPKTVPRSLGESSSAGLRRGNLLTADSSINMNDLIASLPDPETASRESYSSVSTEGSEAPAGSGRISRRTVQSRQPTAIPETLIEKLRVSILTNDQDPYSEIDPARAVLLGDAFQVLGSVDNEFLEYLIDLMRKEVANALAQ